MTDRSFSPVSSINKTDRHNMAEILLKMALITIILILLVNITELPDEGCYRSGSCALSKIYMYIYLHSYMSLGRCICWWTISPLGYHPHSSQCFGGTDLVYLI